MGKTMVYHGGKGLRCSGRDHEFTAPVSYLNKKKIYLDKNVYLDKKKMCSFFYAL